MNIENMAKVLILEVHAKASIPIIESCKAMGLYVIAGSFKKHCCGLYSRAVDQKIIYPSPIFNVTECKEYLLNFLRNNQVSVMFPVGGDMTYLIAANQEAFRKYTRFVLPDEEIFKAGYSKILTLKTARKAGCPIPRTWYPKEQNLNEIAGMITNYPVLIKPDVGTGARGIKFCYNKKELLDNFPKIESEFGISFIQEFIPQTGVQYKVDAVMDFSQKLLSGVVYAKLRYYPPNGGSSVLNKTEYRPDILQQAVSVMKELKWVGFCDFDFITDPRDGVVKLMEINPRFPESYRATVIAGVDMTKIIYELAMGQTPQTQLEYKTGMYLRFLFGDIMWFLTTKENRFKVKPFFFIITLLIDN